MRSSLQCSLDLSTFEAYGERGLLEKPDALLWYCIRMVWLLEWMQRLQRWNEARAHKLIAMSSYAILYNTMNASAKGDLHAFFRCFVHPHSLTLFSCQECGTKSVSFSGQAHLCTELPFDTCTGIPPCSPSPTPPVTVSAHSHSQKSGRDGSMGPRSLETRHSIQQAP
jgi:hypothetical protein